MAHEKQTLNILPQLRETEDVAPFPPLLPRDPVDKVRTPPSRATLLLSTVSLLPWTSTHFNQFPGIAAINDDLAVTVGPRMLPPPSQVCRNEVGSRYIPRNHLLFLGFRRCNKGQAKYARTSIQQLLHKISHMEVDFPASDRHDDSTFRRLHFGTDYVGLTMAHPATIPSNLTDDKNVTTPCGRRKA